MTRTTKKMALVTILLAGLVSACTHPKTPAGHEGYVYHVPLIFGKAEYRKTMQGPASTGVSWRLYVINIDMRARSYKEDFKLLTRDNLSVEFEVNTRISLRPGSVQRIVEQWGGNGWYAWNVKEPLRTTVRRTVTRVSAIDIQLKTNVVKQTINERLIRKYKDTPIKIESVDIGNIRFPRAVTRAIERKIGQQQELERQAYLLAKTKKEAAIRVLEALKAAKQQVIISQTLDHLYVQRQAIQVYKLLAQSPNKTILVLPNSPRGTGLPLILRSDKRKTLSPADRELLEAMEKRYMKLARTGKLEPMPRGAALIKRSSEGAAGGATPDGMAPGGMRPGAARPGAMRPGGRMAPMGRPGRRPAVMR